MTRGFERFPDFSKELKRSFPIHENCYDCAEFYDGCNAWPESKVFRCADYLRLPDVMPGTCGQLFPPSRMKGRNIPHERHGEPATARPAPMVQMPTLATAQIDPKRRCPCGHHLPRRRRYCDTCREARRREAKVRFEQKHPGRSHRTSNVPQKATGAAGDVPESRAIVNRYHGPTCLRDSTET
jgi:hypothetical protein